MITRTLTSDDRLKARFGMVSSTRANTVVIDVVRAGPCSIAVNHSASLLRTLMQVAIAERRNDTTS
jgi:hypothetical protein